MKIINPNREKKTGGKDLTAAQKTALKTAIAAWDATKPVITFDELRALLPVAKRKITQGDLHQFLLDEGFEVLPDDE